MARIRTIKPEFWTSEQVVECSTTARLLFIGLWNFCDDAGRHSASISRIKMQVFPADDITQDDIAELVNELIDAGLVRPYEASGKHFWQVTGWHHQKIDKPTYRHPPPPEFDEPSPTTLDDHSGSPRRGIDERSPPEGKGMEGNAGTNVPGGKEPPDSPAGEPDDPAALIFGAGLQLLIQAGVSERSARSFLGRHKSRDEIKLARLIGEMLAKPPLEPQAYIEKAMQPKRRSAA